MKTRLLAAAVMAGMATHSFGAVFLANPASPIPPSPENRLLTGDVRLACEAVLCLSSGTRPNECAPSLKRYFSIHKRKFKDTLNARKNFLQMCPTSNADGMPELISTLVNGAGRCDAAALNRNGRYVGTGNDRRYVVNTHKPAYCQEYEKHGWTDIGETRLEPVYCEKTETVRRRWQKTTQTSKYQCGQKWVDVPSSK